MIRRALHLLLGRLAGVRRSLVLVQRYDEPHDQTRPALLLGRTAGVRRSLVLVLERIRRQVLATTGARSSRTAKVLLSYKDAYSQV